MNSVAPRVGPEDRTVPIRHLPVLEPRPLFRRALGGRWLAVGLVVAAVGLYAWTYFLPWWHITLFAPQYPKGLGLSVSLTGVGGDVREIDTLNHYIGMAPLGQAAPLERSLAGYGLALFGTGLVGLVLLLGRRLSPLLALLGALLPTGFVLDSMYWLHRFGHDLNPRAPLRMAPFTPQLFGEGHIGQFRTVAQPEIGFWVAVGATALVVAAVLVRRGVCARCVRRGECGPVCPSGFVGPGSGLDKSAPRGVGELAKEESS